MRALAAIAMALVLATGLLVVGAPAAIRAQGLYEFPVITVDPSCTSESYDDVAGYMTITVRGHGFTPGGTVGITFLGQAAQPPGNAILVGEFGTFESTFQVYDPGTAGTYSVDAYDPVNGQRTSASFRVPCPPVRPVLTISPDCGDAGMPATVHVVGTGFFDGYNIQAGILDYVATGNPPYVVSEPFQSSGGFFELDLAFTPPVNGVYRVAAAQSSVGASILATRGVYIYAYFTVPCPVLTVVPYCERAGGPPPDRYAITISGTGFIPGRSLEIIFDPNGIRADYSWDYVVNEDGSWGPEEINPYARGPGVYEVLIRQTDYNESLGSYALHETRVALTVPCAATVVLDPPACDSPQFLGDEARTWDVGATGSGFQPGHLVTFTFDADGVSLPAYLQEATQAYADALGVAVATLTVAARPAGSYRVLASQQVNDALIEGSATFRSPCTSPRPRVSLDPVCGPAAPTDPYSIVVTGRGFIPGYVEIVFDPTGTPELFSAFAGVNGGVTRTINPTSRGSGGYQVLVQQRDANGVLGQAQAAFTVTCATDLTPTLTISPASATPGFVVIVTGNFFPENTTLQLYWDNGIGKSRPLMVTTDGSGTFEKQVLIFRHDFLGTRTMSVGTQTDLTAFPGTTAPLLVVAGRGSPPVYNVFGGGAGGGQPEPIVIRR